MALIWSAKISLYSPAEGFLSYFKFTHSNYIFDMKAHGFNDVRSTDISCNFQLVMPACIGSYVDHAFQMMHARNSFSTVARVHQVRNLAPQQSNIL